MRLLFAMIGYFCVATVITGVAGYGYLRHTGKLNDEKMFEVLAIMHEVDLDEIDAARSGADSETPPEEMSYAQQQAQLQVAALQFDAKRKELAESLEEFQHRFAQLNEATDRANRVSDKVLAFLKEQKEKAMDKALRDVREQLRILIPQKQAKPILSKMIDDGDVDEVIQLLASLPTRSRQAIVKTFVTDEDIDQLYLMTQRMLDGDPTLPYLEQQLKEMEALQAEDK